MISIKTALGLGLALTPGVIIWGVNHVPSDSSRLFSEPADVRSLNEEEVNAQAILFNDAPLDPWNRPYRYQLIDGRPV
ncbi:MAG: hypothetical protein AAF492_32410, partial [Verrucomicrobiota bacterium]